MHTQIYTPLTFRCGCCRDRFVGTICPQIYVTTDTKATLTHPDCDSCPMMPQNGISERTTLSLPALFLEAKTKSVRVGKETTRKKTQAGKIILKRSRNEPVIQKFHLWLHV